MPQWKVTVTAQCKEASVQGDVVWGKTGAADVD